MAIYFVDISCGSNSNDGLSWQTPKVSISESIASASAGDTIYIAGGVYDGHTDGTNDIIVDKNNLTITSPYSSIALIDKHRNATNKIPINIISATGINISNIAVAFAYEKAIQISNSNVNLNNMRIVRTGYGAPPIASVSSCSISISSSIVNFNGLGLSFYTSNNYNAIGICSSSVAINNGILDDIAKVDAQYSSSFNVNFSYINSRTSAAEPLLGAQFCSNIYSNNNILEKWSGDYIISSDADSIISGSKNYYYVDLTVPEFAKINGTGYIFDIYTGSLGQDTNSYFSAVNSPPFEYEFGQQIPKVIGGTSLIAFSSYTGSIPNDIFNNTRTTSDTTVGPLQYHISQSLYTYPLHTSSTTYTVYEKANEFGQMIVSGNTSYGTFDADPKFTADATKTAQWMVRVLGYPIMNVELTDPMLFDTYERATNKYSEMINNAESINWLSSYIGKAFDTGSNWTGRLPVVTENWLKRFVQPATSMMGKGRQIQMKTGSVDLSSDQIQWIDLADFSNTNENGAHLQIHHVFYEPDPAIDRSFNPASYMNLIDSESMPAYAGGSANITYMTPLFDTALRARTVKMSDTIRRSRYSWQILGNKLFITPPTWMPMRLYFLYTTPLDPLSPEYVGQAASSPVVTSAYNIPFGVITYSNINSAGKQWIREYALACAKEMLANVRGKFGDIPIPGETITLNADRMASEADAEKDKLIDKLKELLDATALKTLLANEAEAAESAGTVLKTFPTPMPIMLI